MPTRCRRSVDAWGELRNGRIGIKTYYCQSDFKTLQIPAAVTAPAPAWSGCALQEPSGEAPRESAWGILPQGLVLRNPTRELRDLNQKSADDSLKDFEVLGGIYFQLVKSPK